MTWKNTHLRYGSLSIALHWLMVLLLIAVYACMEFRGFFDKGTPGRALIMQFHFMLGLSVFALVWLRLLARTLGETPEIVPAPPLWQRALATLMHWALYALMIVLPVLGWLTLSGLDRPVPFWGLTLPALMPADRDLAVLIEDWHIRIAEWGYWLIGLHTVAGLGHHYGRRDNTLKRMLAQRF